MESTPLACKIRLARMQKGQTAVVYILTVCMLSALFDW